MEIFLFQLRSLNIESRCLSLPLQIVFSHFEKIHLLYLVCVSFQGRQFILKAQPIVEHKHTYYFAHLLFELLI